MPCSLEMRERDGQRFPPSLVGCPSGGKANGNEHRDQLFILTDSREWNLEKGEGDAAGKERKGRRNKGVLVEKKSLKRRQESPIFIHERCLVAMCAPSPFAPWLVGGGADSDK